SVVCPILNEEKNIATFLDYLLAQAYIPEIVLVDGGSTDKTIEIVRSYQKKSNKIKLIELKERGTGKAINVGFKNSSGLYICHSGADFGFLGKNIFSKAVDFIKKNPKTKILALAFPLKKRFNNIIKDSFLFWDSRYSLNLIVPIVKREIFPTYPEISYGEDKIAAKSLEQYFQQAQTLFLEEDFLRFQKDFSLNLFIKRYLWYGRTFLPYLKLANEPKEYLRILLCVLAVFFPPILLIPFLVGIYDAIKFLKIFPLTVVFFPIFSMAASWLMGIGFLIGFFVKDLGH
ncbi:MAG: glycosyltransferase family 2 protein, partial [Candidatus Anstonellaceae archaeon]